MDLPEQRDEHSGGTRKLGIVSPQDWVAGWLEIHRLTGILWNQLQEKNSQESLKLLVDIQTESRLLSNTIKLILENDHAKNVFR
jgi:hypothetical protein